jgi:hypothetical protein
VALTSPDNEGCIPRDWRRRLDQLTADVGERHLAGLLANLLDGADPAALLRSQSQLRKLSARFDDGFPMPQLERALELLVLIDYGIPREHRAAAEILGVAARTRTVRDHGAVLSERLDQVVGKLPRALALRYPTTDDRQAGRDAQQARDVYGTVNVNHNPRDGHLGCHAAIGGLWTYRSAGDDPYVQTTEGELIYLLRNGRRSSRRGGGGDYRWIRAIALDLAREKITATVEGQNPSKAHVIPHAPVVSVEAWLGREWVDIRTIPDWVERGAPMALAQQPGTLRFRLAAWVLAELKHQRRRATFINFGVWRRLGGQGRRLYAYVQGLEVKDSAYGHRVDNELIQLNERTFFLAKPLRFTLGLRGARADKAAAAVRDQLAFLYDIDQRYHVSAPEAPTGAPGFRQSTMPGTVAGRGEGAIASFQVFAFKGRGSRPRHEHATGRPLARVRLRGYVPRRIRISDHDIDPRHVTAIERRRAGGFEAARANIARRREEFVNAARDEGAIAVARHRLAAIDEQDATDVDRLLADAPPGPEPPGRSARPSAP